MYLRVTYPTLEVANTHRKLRGAFPQTPALSRLLSEIFHESSVACADATATFLRRNVRDTADAERVAGLLKSYAGAVPRENAGALAEIAAYLAVTFNDPACGVALQTFAFADPVIKRLAVRVVCSCVVSSARRSVAPVRELLARTHPFFSHVAADADIAARLHVIHAIIALPFPVAPIDVARFLRTLPTAVSSFSDASADLRNDDHPRFDAAVDVLQCTAIARGATSASAFRDLVMDTLVRAVDFAALDALDALQEAYAARFTAAVADVSFDVFVFLISVIIAVFACQGRLSACYRGLTLLHTVTRDERMRDKKLHPVVASAVAVVSTPISSIASVATDDEISRLSSLLFQRAHDSAASFDANAHTSLLERCDDTMTAALRSDCPVALTVLSLLYKLLSQWHSPKSMRSWLSSDLTHTINSQAFDMYRQNSKEVHTGIADVFDQDEKTYDLRDDGVVQGSNIDRSVLSLCTAVSLFVCLYHDNCKVRMAAADALSQFPDAATMLFCFPATMIRLREETHPIVAIRLLRGVLVCDALLMRRETAGVVLGALLQIMRSLDARVAASTLQTGFIAIAKAAKYAPGLVTKITLEEIERLRARFGSTRADERIAGASTVLTFARERPSRAAKFVPFITLCIQQESMDIAPLAAALCLDAMYVMACEDVMDPVKTVKIVIKKIPSVVNLDPGVRRSFLRLIGTVSRKSNSKKGKAVAEISISILRKCLTEWVPDDSETDKISNFSLSWGHVAEAAQVLIQFSVNDVLRIAYRLEDPLIDVEAERLRLQKIEEECAVFVKSLLVTARKAQEKNALEPVQALLNKIATHEWENRPRGNFDPERIAKLRATSDALRRSRKNRVVGMASTQEEKESVRAQFAHAVEGMPIGVIKALCEQCACLDACAVWAVAQAGAVTTALPWVTLIDDALRENVTGYQLAACLRTLRLAKGDHTEISRVRSRWFVPKSITDCDKKQTVEIFLGCLTLFEDRVPEVLQFVTRAETVIALVEALAYVEGVDDDRRRAVAIQLLCLTQHLAPNWDSVQTTTVEDVLFKHILHRGVRIAALDIIRLPTPSYDDMDDDVGLSPLRARLACRTGEPGIVRMVMDVVVRDQRSIEDVSLLKEVGVAVGQLSLDGRRSAIRQLAETPSRRGAVVACHAIGAGAFSTDVHHALIAGLSLCEASERVAVKKLANFLVMVDAAEPVPP